MYTCNDCGKKVRQVGNKRHVKDFTCTPCLKARVNTKQGLKKFL